MAISSGEFQSPARELGFTVQEAKRLFQALDVHGADLLTFEELEFLSDWNSYRDQILKRHLDVWRPTIGSYCYKYTTQCVSKRRMRNHHVAHLAFARNAFSDTLKSLPELAKPNRSSFTERQKELRRMSMEDL